MEIKNPSLPETSPAVVTRKAFELVHRANGFEIVGDPAARPPADETPVTVAVPTAKPGAKGGASE